MMKLTVLKRGKDLDEDMATDPDFVSLLKARDIHYVSLAVPGLTVVSACVEFAGGFDVRQRNDFMLRVNRAKETGTLYPRANISLLPSPTASYAGLDHNVHRQGEYSEHEIARRGANVWDFLAQRCAEYVGTLSSSLPVSPALG